MSHVIHPETAQAFHDLALTPTSGVVIVDFYADRCGPCKMLTPVMEEIANDYADTVKVIKINVDELQTVAGAYRVQSIPTVIIFNNGHMIGQPHVGASPAEYYTDIVDTLIPEVVA